MIDLSEILPCPNCNSRPRCTGFRSKIPVKIRCSNKSCELSRESVPTGFWQGINRTHELEKAFDQFKASLEAERKRGDECFEMCQFLYNVNIKMSGSRNEVIINLDERTDKTALNAFLALEKIVKKYEV